MYIHVRVVISPIDPPLSHLVDIEDPRHQQLDEVQVMPHQRPQLVLPRGARLRKLEGRTIILGVLFFLPTSYYMPKIYYVSSSRIQ